MVVSVPAFSAVFGIASLRSVPARETRRSNGPFSCLPAGSGSWLDALRREGLGGEARCR